MSFYNPKKWNYITVKGLGFIKGIHCPHYDSSTKGVPRKSAFQDMIHEIGGIGIAIDGSCAIEFIDDKYRVITSKDHANAFRVFRKRGRVISAIIPKRKTFTQVAKLYKLDGV